MLSEPCFLQRFCMRKQLFIKIKRKWSSTNLKAGNVWSGNDGPHLSLARPVTARRSPLKAGAHKHGSGSRQVCCGEPSNRRTLGWIACRYCRLIAPQGDPRRRTLARPALTTRCKHKIVKILYP